jgi:hypothetical protein
MRLMLVAFVLVVLLLIDHYRFRGHYTHAASDTIVRVVKAR